MELQAAFFDLIRKQLGSNKDLVGHLCDLLSISQDSAYRRLRGETAITLPEIKILSNHFGLSVDGLLDNRKDLVTFNYKWIDPNEFNYTEYLRSLREDTKRIALFGNNEILFAAKDLPIFYNFHIPEIAEFKGFFWQKTALNQPALSKAQFDPDNLISENISLGYEIIKAYNLIPSVEMWHPELLNSLLNQIVYYYDSGFFKQDSVAGMLLDKLDELLAHLQEQAELGSKFLIGKQHVIPDNYQLYYNEVSIGDNTLCLRTDAVKTVYFTQNIINNIVTRDTLFCEQTWKIHSNMVKRSVDLTGSNERDRNKFFRKLRNTVQMTRERLV